MNKKEFIKSVSGKLNKTMKETEEILDAILEAMEESFVSGESIKFAGFGNFEVVDKPEKKCRNPKTGEEVICPPCKGLKFKPAKALKDAVNGK